MRRLTHHVLQSRPRPQRPHNAPVRRRLLIVHDGNRIDADRNEDDVDDDQLDLEPQPIDENNPEAAPVPEEETIRLSGTYISRLIIGSLLLPDISKLMGRLLFWMSRRSPVLRTVLGLRVNGRDRVFPVRLAGRSVASLGLWSWHDLDPVWYVCMFS